MKQTRTRVLIIFYTSIILMNSAAHAANNRFSAPVVTTGSATVVSASGANLNGTVNPKGRPTTYYFEYGTSTKYGMRTNSTSAGSGSSTVAVKAGVSALASSATYHFRIVASNLAGTSYGADFSFT